MNVSGHLLSTSEIESALVSDDDVVEAAVVAAPHDIKGNFPYAFITLRLVLFNVYFILDILKNRKEVLKIIKTD